MSFTLIGQECLQQVSQLPVIGKQLLEVFVYKIEHIRTRFYILSKTELGTTYVASSRRFDILFQISGMAHFDINCMLLLDSDNEDEPREEAFIVELQVDIIEWFRQCHMNSVALHNYYSQQRRRICRFSFTRNDHMFMLDVMACNPQQCYAKFRMYPPMLRMFTHILRDQFGLYTLQQIDVYEQDRYRRYSIIRQNYQILLQTSTLSNPTVLQTHNST